MIYSLYIKHMDHKQMQWNVSSLLTNLNDEKVCQFKFPGINLQFYKNISQLNYNVETLRLHVNFNPGSGYIKSNQELDRKDGQHSIIFCQSCIYTDADEYVNPCNIDVITIHIAGISIITFEIELVPMIHYGIILKVSDIKPTRTDCLSLMKAQRDTTIIESNCIGIFKDFADSSEIYRWLFKDEHGQKILYNLLSPMWHRKRKCIVNRIRYTLPNYENYKGKNPKIWFKTLISLADKGDHMWDIIGDMNLAYNGKGFKIISSPPICDISTCPIHILPESSKTPCISSRFKWNDGNDNTSEESDEDDINLCDLKI